jgi:DNA ligase-1
LGEEYEEARIALKNSGGGEAKVGQSKAKATTSRAKPGSKRKRTEEDEEGDNPVGKSSGRTRTAKSNSKRSKVETIPEAALIPASKGDRTNDELAEINGVRPHVYLREGEEHDVGSATG